MGASLGLELFSEAGKSEDSSDGLPNSEVLVDITREGDLLGFPSHFVGSQSASLNEVSLVGKGDALNSGGVSHCCVLLRSSVVWYVYILPHNS